MSDLQTILETTQEQEEQVLLTDYFDLLPDAILLIIFNKVLDATSLCRCLTLSKRCATLVTQVDSLSIQMNSSKQKKPISDNPSTKNGSSLVFRNNMFFKGFFSKLISKPFGVLSNMMMGKKANSSSVSKESKVNIFSWVGSTLRNFSEIERIKLELPCHGGEIGVNKAIPLLKWEAGFGKELEKCVILGANSVVERVRTEKVVGEGEGGGDVDEVLFSDEELKLRIIWIISCLIASSARHNLMKKMVSDCPKLSSAAVSDAGKQGMLCMDAGQIRELRDSLKSNVTANNDSDASAGSNSGNNSSAEAQTQMGYVGNLVMKLWYVKELDLPSCGVVMKGATLVVIRPDGEDKDRNKDGLSLNKCFERDEVFGEAAKELFKRKEKRVYRLEMNAF